MDYNQWLTMALESIESNVKINQKFEVKELFRECEWNELGRGERIGFGKFFSNEVREGNIPNVRYVERNKNNHSKYVKEV